MTVSFHALTVLRGPLTAGLVLLVALAGSLRAASTFDRVLGADEKSAMDQVKNDLMSMGGGSESGTGPVPYLRALGAPPKRVALVSFYTWDTGNTKGNFYNTSVRWKSTDNVTSSGIQAVTDGLYAAGASALKEGFASFGMTLLTPTEFLNTPDKKAAYEAFQLEHGALGSVMGVFSKSSADKTRLDAAPEGYRLLKLPIKTAAKRVDYGLAAQGGDGKLFQGLGHELASALGVDAVVIVYNVVQAESKTINLLGSYLYCFGPNPVAKASGSMSWTGHQYSGAALKLNVELIKGGHDTEYYFAGYAQAARALAMKTGTYLRERTTAGK